MASRVLHDRNSEARNNFTEVFDRTTSGAKWMGAVWVVDEQGKVVLVQNTTFQFPSGGFAEALGQLALALAEEKARLQTGPMLPDEPLPNAVILPMINQAASCPACKLVSTAEITLSEGLSTPLPLPEALEVTGMGVAKPLGVDLPVTKEEDEESGLVEDENALKSFPEL